MRFGGNYVLGSAARIVAIAVALFASTSFAQTISPAQSSPSTSPTAPSATTAGQNPDTGPPRTAQPIPSAQEQPGQASTEQQPHQIDRNRLSPSPARTIRAGLCSRSRCKKWCCMPPWQTGPATS